MSNRSPHYLDENKGIETFEYETRYLIKKLLNKVLSGESQGESLRQSLARRPLFSATDAFNALDSNEIGFISVEEFKILLNEWNFFVSTSDLVTLVNRYDKNNDGKISYGEFLNEITPKSPLKY
uniref:EF-hand domain-containing protein n=1 Tax=Anophryoides haemophila TaxID=46462 RepID=A0A7S3IC81_9CILI|mmetsp:Transcript_20465/g.2740  ORF Transcript_20465/g.2740 Transcript_20465/m.2740 type:complete len:124 (+) Transcript_20465:625-996(+)